MLSLVWPQVAVQLAPVTEWLPLKQSPARSSTATVAIAIGALSIGGNSDESKESITEATGPSGMEGLWRPSPKVASGAKGDSRSNNLSEAGILAQQGNLQPVGKVVFIVENKHRVRFMVAWSATKPPRCVCFSCVGYADVGHLRDGAFSFRFLIFASSLFS